MSTHATHLTYSAFVEDWRFSVKAKYARLRTPRGPRTGFRKSSSSRPYGRPRIKGFAVTNHNLSMKRGLTPSSRFIAVRLRLMAHLCATHLYERSMRMLIRRREKAHPIRQKFAQIIPHSQSSHNRPVAESTRTPQKTASFCKPTPQPALCRSSFPHEEQNNNPVGKWQLTVCRWRIFRLKLPCAKLRQKTPP